MPTIYALDAESRAQNLPSIRCKDGDTELQRILALNPYLIPGDQICPEAPRRWLLIGQEMPANDPGSGAARWNIDVVLGDQDAVPTFVECKRFLDTQSRREIVGQMLEYAANGHHYWEAANLLAAAAESARATQADLEALIEELGGGEFESPSDYFGAMQANLRNGRMRLVFFLDEAPHELKSIVDFLNRQMEQSEVLIVEARQYQCGDTRLVAPAVFGYSEEARRAKQSGERTREGHAGRGWDENSFFETAAAALAPTDVEVARDLLASCRNAGLTIRWGTGTRRGSFNVVAPAISTCSVLSVFSDGMLWVNGWWLDDAPRPEHTALLAQLRDLLGKPEKTTLDGSFGYALRDCREGAAELARVISGAGGFGE